MLVGGQEGVLVGGEERVLVGGEGGVDEELIRC